MQLYNVHKAYPSLTAGPMFILYVYQEKSADVLMAWQLEYVHCAVEHLHWKELCKLWSKKMRDYFDISMQLVKCDVFLWCLA